LPRDLSGRELAAGLCRHWNYQEISQEGSHLLLVTEIPGRQRIAVPLHKPVKLGTLNNILRCVASHKGVSHEAVLRAIL
jgi:predicted RNA binding protein YcfA (HicA-like mRNA interferase family)